MDVREKHIAAWRASIVFYQIDYAASEYLGLPYSEDDSRLKKIKKERELIAIGWNLAMRFIRVWHTEPGQREDTLLEILEGSTLPPGWDTPEFRKGPYTLKEQEDQLLGVLEKVERRNRRRNHA